jgi:hypothetical protein
MVARGDSTRMESTTKPDTSPRRARLFRPPDEVIDAVALQRALEARDPSWETARYDHPLPRRAAAAFEVAREIFG